MKVWNADFIIGLVCITRYSHMYTVHSNLLNSCYTTRVAADTSVAQHQQSSKQSQRTPATNLHYLHTPDPCTHEEVDSSTPELTPPGELCSTLWCLMMRDTASCHNKILGLWGDQLALWSHLEVLTAQPKRFRSCCSNLTACRVPILGIEYNMTSWI